MLPNIKWVQLIDWKKSMAVDLNLNKNTFVMHITYLKAKMSIYQAW